MKKSEAIGPKTRIILDTNVVVSALIQSHSIPFLVLDSILDTPKLELCISEALFREYKEVINRDKFKKFPRWEQSSKLILSLIEQLSVLYYPKVKIDLMEDTDDNRLLELAQVSQAHFLVTGNHKDFNFSSFERTQIMSPKEFFETVLS
ncbi:MAG: putative toxin-antitoxin system toxin component, PIN family [Bacteroidota bacterium]